MTEVILLDGGMGQELIARSAQPPSPIWSAAVMEREPDLVEAVHRDFLAAGARVLTLNTYPATPIRLRRHLTEDAADALLPRLHATAIRCAQVARQGVPGAAIAGCLPPLGGSYYPEAGPGFEEALATYGRLIDLAEGACDLWLAETMSAVAEARAAARAGARAGVRTWVALSVDDADGTRLRSGEPLEEGCAAAVGEGAEALLLNCSRPEAISEGLDRLAATGLPFGAYGNGFSRAADLAIGGTVDGMGLREDLGPEAYADHAMGWIRRGATIVGGCCEIGPGHIAHLRDRIEGAGHAVVSP